MKRKPEVLIGVTNIAINNSEEGNVLHAELEITPADIDGQSAGSAEVIAVIFEKDLTVDVGGGENRGKTLHHNNVVRTIPKPEEITFEGDKPQQVKFSIRLDKDWKEDDLGIAVIASDPETKAVY